MSGVLRLTLVSHAMTDAMSAGRFPADEALSEVGRRQAVAVDLGPRVPATVWTAPEQRARQTAEHLGFAASVDPRLADMDYGGWRGEALGAVATDALAGWLVDPASAPHGGESVVEVVRRVRDWLDAVPGGAGPVVAVTHPAVVRAAVLVVLGAPPTSFWRVDVAPTSRTVLHRRGGCWTLRRTG